MIKKPKVQLKNVLKLHKDTVIGLYSPGGPTGGMLYSCSKEGCVRILDLNEKKIFNTLLLSKGGPQLEDKSQDMDSESSETQKISLEAFEKGGKIEDLTAIVFTENTIYGGYENGEVFCWNLKNGEVIYEMPGHTKAVKQLIQLNVRIIASASSDNTIRCWDSTSGACENIIKVDGAINHMVKEGKILYILIGHSKIMAVNTENYQVTNCFSLDDKIIVKILVKDNIFYLATTNNKIEVFEWKEDVFTQKAILQGPKDWIQCMKILENHMYAGSDDKIVRVWNLEDHTLVDEFSDHDDGVTCLEFCDRSIYTGSYDHTIRFWRLDEMFERIFNRKRMAREDLQSKKFEAYCKVMFKGKKKGKKGKTSGKKGK